MAVVEQTKWLLLIQAHITRPLLKGKEPGTLTYKLLLFLSTSSFQHKGQA